MKISLIGVPTNSAGRKDGVAKAPLALRNAGLVDVLSRYCDVYDEGDIKFLEPNPQRQNGIIAYDSFVSMIYAVKDRINDALEKNRYPLVIGGDCPILLGCLAATKEIYQNPGLFFIDGHEDAYPPQMSPTGESADMELGFALGMNTSGLTPNLVHLLPLVEKYNVCIFGPRDKKYIDGLGVESLIGKIQTYNDISLQNQNVGTLVGKEVSKMRSQVSRWWVHVDFDVLNSNSMPAVDYPQPGGLSWDTLEKITIPLLSDMACVGMNVTIYNPDLDPSGIHAKRIVKYLQNVFASTNLQKD